MRLTPSLRRIGALAVFGLALSCSDRPAVAPSGPIAPGHSRLSVRPSFQQIPPGGPTIELKSVVARLVGPNGNTITAVAEFQGDSAILVFDVSLPAGSTVYQLDVTALDAQGQPAYHTSGPITIKPGDNAPATPTLIYSAADAALQVLHVAPASVQLSAGGVQSLSVSGTGPNNAPVSSIRVGWTSKNETVASVDAAGVVHAGVLQGSTYIVARTVTNIADSALVHVSGTVAKVTVAPATISIARGLTAGVGAELRDAANTLIDDRSATWASSDPSVATVSATGVVRGVSIGTATITATADGKSASAAVTVVSPIDHIELTPATLTFASLGETQTVTARAIPVTGASVDGIAIGLESSNATVASVTPAGVVTANANGSATIRASAEGKDVTAAVTVRQVATTLAVSPAITGVTYLGDSRAFTPVETDARGNTMVGVADWISSNTSIATVNASGVATGRAPGTVTITAKAGNLSATASFTVSQIPADVRITPERSSMDVGSSQQLTGTVVDAGGSTIDGRTVTFTSSTPGIATVTASGRVTGMSPGTASISAAAGPLTASISLTVVAVPGSGPNVTGVVLNGATGQPIAGATVTPPSGSPATSAADGSFTLFNVPIGSNLTIAANGFTGTTYFTVPTGSNGVASLGRIPLAPVSTNTGSFSGRVVDAVTGFGIPNAAITARSGINNTTGTIVLTTSSDQSGNYSGTLPAGTYTVLASAIGYANSSGVIPAVGGSTQLNQNIVMSPSGLSNNQYRIVLQWGASPSDLDSHLVGPTGTGTNFEIAYYARSYSQNGTQIASLDRDVTSGFGPETITLSQTTAGHYRYYVHIFCCGNSFGTAQVTVYRGSSVAAQFSAPTQTGSVWTVFEIDGTTGGVASINTVSGIYNIPGSGSTSFNVIPSRSAEPEDVSALLQRVKLHPKPPPKPSR